MVKTHYQESLHSISTEVALMMTKSSKSSSNWNKDLIVSNIFIIYGGSLEKNINGREGFNFKVQFS